MKKFNNFLNEISGEPVRMTKFDKTFLIVTVVFLVLAWVLASHADTQSFVELHKSI